MTEKPNPSESSDPLAAALTELQQTLQQLCRASEQRAAAEQSVQAGRGALEAAQLAELRSACAATLDQAQALVQRADAVVAQAQAQAREAKLLLRYAQHSPAQLRLELDAALKKGREQRRCLEALLELLDDTATDVSDCDCGVCKLAEELDEKIDGGDVPALLGFLREYNVSVSDSESSSSDDE